MKHDISEIIPFEDYIGKQVRKKSDKPFKSRRTQNTVKGVVNHPKLNIPAFTFIEDNSYVECRRCHLDFFHVIQIIRESTFHHSDEEAKVVIDGYLDRYPELLEAENREWFYKMC
jgi:hypothetical protein